MANWNGGVMRSMLMIDGNPVSTARRNGVRRCLHHPVLPSRQRHFAAVDRSDLFYRGHGTSTGRPVVRLCDGGESKFVLLIAVCKTEFPANLALR